MTHDSDFSSDELACVKATQRQAVEEWAVGDLYVERELAFSERERDRVLPQMAS